MYPAACHAHVIQKKDISLSGRGTSKGGPNLQHVRSKNAHERWPGGQQLHSTGSPGTEHHGKRHQIIIIHCKAVGF